LALWNKTTWIGISTGKAKISPLDLAAKRPHLPKTLILVPYASLVVKMDKLRQYTVLCHTYQTSR
jgi:hypothetical protein